MDEELKKEEAFTKHHFVPPQSKMLKTSMRMGMASPRAKGNDGNSSVKSLKGLASPVEKKEEGILKVVDIDVFD